MSIESIKVGDHIKVFHFREFPGRPVSYIIGRVIDINNYSYTVSTLCEVVHDAKVKILNGKNDEYIIPSAIYNDWDGRIQKIQNKDLILN